MSRTGDIAQVYQDPSGQYRYRILARNSEIIAEGESYTRKGDCIDVLEAHFPTASIVDLTLVEETE